MSVINCVSAFFANCSHYVGKLWLEAISQAALPASMNFANVGQGLLAVRFRDARKFIDAAYIYCQLNILAVSCLKYVM